MAVREPHEGPQEGDVCARRHRVRTSRHAEGLLCADTSRRPGILVLINDADWELEGEDQYEIQQGDNIVFVSTLHGG